MYIPRIIPCLLMKGDGLYKTTTFSNPVYLGDPINTIRIFNEKEVDELILLDIAASLEGRGPNFESLMAITSECFMPVCYGGGVTTLKDMERLIRIGIEKVALNSKAVEHPEFVAEAAAQFGSQSVIVSIDVERKLLGRLAVCSHAGTRRHRICPVEHARRMQESGAGEIMINAIHRDGTMKGYDLGLLRLVSEAVTLPVIACGGAGSLEDLRSAIVEGGATAAAAGSLFVFHGRHRAVLISYPSRKEIDGTFHAAA